MRLIRAPPCSQMDTTTAQTKDLRRHGLCLGYLGSKEYTERIMKRMTRGETLKALYDHAKPLGMGFLHYRPAPMDIKEADSLALGESYFDYLYGRVMKVDLNKLDSYLYNRDNGPGAMDNALSCTGCVYCKVMGE